MAQRRPVGLQLLLVKSIMKVHATLQTFWRISKKYGFFLLLWNSLNVSGSTKRMGGARYLYVQFQILSSENFSNIAQILQ